MIPPTDAVLNRISQEFPYEDLVAATDGFSASASLGEGTYGTVFSGVLRDGTEVAIKALASPKEGGFREEVEVLSRFRHPNLVILMGFARNGRERYLVYELLPGGDVNSRLNKDLNFTWKLRLNVILDAALGLSHLHGSRPQVFHRDVKTQNILMDRNGTGKVADFGLACLAQPNQDRLAVSQTSGTIGYADPLYIRTGVVTEKSEVYSLGMVLLEVLTGRPPALQHPSGRIEYQFDHLNGELRKLFPMVDRRGMWPEMLAQRIGALALQCTCEHEAYRPSFVDIVKQLRGWLRDEQLQRGDPARALGPADGSHSQPQRAAAHEAIGQGGPAAARAADAPAPRAAAPVEVHAAHAYTAQAHATPWSVSAEAPAAGHRATQQPWQQQQQQQQQQQPRAEQQRPLQHGGSNPFSGPAPAAVAERWPSTSVAAAMPAAAGRAGLAGERRPLAAGSWAEAEEAHSRVAEVLRPQRQPRQQQGQEDGKLQQLMEMGYTRKQAQEACRRCSTVEAAVEWILTTQ